MHNWISIHQRLIMIIVALSALTAIGAYPSDGTGTP